MPKMLETRRPKVDFNISDVVKVIIGTASTHDQLVPYLERGSVFWHGDLLGYCRTFLSAHVSGVFVSLDFFQETPRSSWEVVLEYIPHERVAQTLSPPKGARPFYAPISGVLDIYWKKLGTRIEASGFRIGGTPFPSYFIPELVAETGDSVSAGELLFYYFASAPTKIQVKNYMAKNKVVGAYEELKEIEKQVEEARQNKTNAEAEANVILENAITEAIIAASHKAKKMSTEAEERQASILESARQQRREASELRKSAEAETKRQKDAAKNEAQAIKSQADTRAQQTLAAAEKDAEATKIEAANQLQQIKDDADKLELEAVTDRLYSLMAGGAKAELLQRPQLRTLAFKLSQLVADSQGVAAPESVSLLKTQNKYDELDAMFDALAQKINAINARENWPDEVKQMAIDALTSSAEVKTGALTDEDLADD